MVTREMAFGVSRHARRSLAALLSAAGALAACGGSQSTQQPTMPVQQTPPVAQQTTSGRDPYLDSAEYRAIAQRAAATLNFNADSNFGGAALRTGFTPEPWGFRLTAGGGSDAINVAELGLRDDVTGQPCTQAFVTRRPDFHFTFEAGNTFSMVRFYVVTENNADATLLINQPDTRWRCNDDHGQPGWGNPTMPVIDFHNPMSGRYDIWVGSYDRSAHNPATLFVTELNSNHP